MGWPYSRAEVRVDNVDFLWGNRPAKPFSGVFGNDIYSYSSSGAHLAQDARPPWRTGSDYIVKNPIGNFLMEHPRVAVTEQIQLEGLGLYTLGLRNICYYDPRKIRLTGDGTNTREFRAVELYDIISPGISVRKGLQAGFIRAGRILLLTRF